MVSVSLIEDLKLREALTEISVHYNTIRQQNYVAQKSYNQKCQLLEWYRKNLMYARCVKKHLQDLHDENILDQNRTHAPLTSTYWVFFDNPSTRKDPISFMTSLDVQLGKIEQKSRQTISGLNRLLVHFHRLSALIRSLHLSCTERMGLQHVQRIKNAQSVSNDAITDLERVLIHYVVSLESEKRKRLQLEKTLKREKAKKLFLDACNILEMRQLNNVLT